MSRLQHLRQFWQRVRSLAPHKFPAEAAEKANHYAAEAYRCCVVWYGPPQDPQNSYRLWQTDGDSVFVAQLLPKGDTHAILISKEADTPELLCEHIAHEMCHRVMVGRSGLVCELWIREMLACLTSHWFCRRQDLEEHAARIKTGWLGVKGKTNIGLLREATNNTRRWLLHGEDTYSEEFLKDFMRVGFALTHVVDASHIRRLSQTETLDEWIVTVPLEDQYAVCRVLELPCSDKIMPATEEQWGRLYNGLKLTGDYEAMVADFESLSRLHPESHKPAYYLGRAYQGAERYSAALQAYLKARELGSTDRWTPRNIASVYWHEKEYLLAAEWYGKAFDEGQQWAQARYWQGRAQQKLGDLTGARVIWEQVLTLGDEECQEKARKALEDNPPSDASPIAI